MPSAGHKSKEHAILDIVIAIHGPNKELIRQAVTDFRSRAGRNFLDKTLWWALHSKYTVLMRALRPGEHVEEIDNREDDNDVM